MGRALAEHEIEAVVREVTDEKVAFYHEYGWVMIKQLVDPEFATKLLGVGQAWLERDEEEKDARRAVGLVLQEEAEPFRSLFFSQRMSKNAMRLINRKRLKGVDVPLRYRADVFREKPPGATVTQYHQDSSQHGSDRVGELQFWLALAEVTPEMSAMRFVSRSHREGPLGSTGGGQGDLLEQYPNLTSVLDLSPPFHYQPGDCTVHDGYTVHGAPVNSTDKSRWSYLFSYSPSDTRYWNGTAANWGSERKRLSDEDNPTVYFPDSEEV